MKPRSLKSDAILSPAGRKESGVPSTYESYKQKQTLNQPV